MITLWFPTVIAHEFYEKHLELKNVLEPMILQRVHKNPHTSHWIGNTPNSLNVWDPLLEEQLDPIRQFKQWVEEQTNELAFKMGSMDQFEVKESWANLYNRGDFQESHYHSNCHFSAVYFMAAPPGSGSLKFESPLVPDMLPLTYFNYNELSNQTADYSAEEGKLVIFRSRVRHGVFPNQTDEKRISLAMNLVRKQ